MERDLLNFHHGLKHLTRLEIPPTQMGVHPMVKRGMKRRQTWAGPE